MSFVSSPHPPPPGAKTCMTFQTTWKCIVQGGNRTTKGAEGLLKYWPLRSPVYTKRQKKRSQYPAILTEQAWSRIYYMAKKRTYLAGPSREIRRRRILPAVTNQKVVYEQALHLGDIVKRTRASGTQGETRPKRNIPFILPTRGLSHIMKHQTGCAEALVQDA